MFVCVVLPHGNIFFISLRSGLNSGRPFNATVLVLANVI